jgi:small subunit ribosomal protein S1
MAKEPKKVAEELEEEITANEANETVAETQEEVTDIAVAEESEEVELADEVEEAGEVEEEIVAEQPADEAEGSDDTEDDEELELPIPDAPFFVHNPEDFDWDAYATGTDEYTRQNRDKMEELYNNTLTSIDRHEVLQGKVVEVNKKEVVVNVGYKSEGVVSASEFRYNPDLKPGDIVEVYVESQEDKNGQLVISHRTARTHQAWDRVNNALEKDLVITGHVKCRTKGGLIVDVFGLEAFLPGSQIDVKPIRDYDIYVGKNMEFKVVKINQEFKNVVVSHKALIEAELEEQKKEIISRLEKGQVLEGTVKNITSYGVFVDLGGIDGLIHITDLSWGRINHPEEVVTLDEKINVVILDFDDDKRRIALGLKQLTGHPWESLAEELEVGKSIKGKVVVLADYGAFVEVAPGVEGLVHVSEMSWSQHLRSAQDFLKVGDEIDAVILTLDKEERKMSLGIKQLMPDPWEAIESKYPLGSRHKAKVRNFTNYGVFAEMEEGVDGLIHISDLSWNKKIKHPSEFCAVGDEIEVQVLEVDKENRRLSLGHKQLEENPWDVFESVFFEGSQHEGTVVAIDNNTATVTLPYGLEGFCSVKHLRKEDNTNARVEDKLQFIVLEFNKGGRRIVVSHTRTFEEDPKLSKTRDRESKRMADDEASRAVKNINARAEKTTLGDIDALADLKDQLEKKEEAGNDDSAS